MYLLHASCKNLLQCIKYTQSPPNLNVLKWRFRILSTTNSRK